METRKVERRDGNTWIEIPFSELKRGDRFRLFEADGFIVKDKNERAEWTAMSDSFPHDTGLLQITVVNI